MVSTPLSILLLVTLVTVLVSETRGEKGNAGFYTFDCLNLSRADTEKLETRVCRSRCKSILVNPAGARAFFM